MKILEPYTRLHPEQGIGSSGGIEIRAPGFLDNTIKVMSAKTSKLGFETGMRVMYLAKKELMPHGERNNHSRDIRLIFRQYARPDCNEFYRINSTQGDAYGGIFTISSPTVMTLANRMLRDYRERDFFYPPLRHSLLSTEIIPWPLSPLFFPAYKHHPTYVLNTEELATIWHFPGQILKVPTLERIESKEAAPPTNLPT